MKNNTIFFLTIPLYGHVFPVLDVINKIGKEGYNTYCFVNDFFAEYIKNDNVSVICYPEKVIANFNTKSSNLLEDEHISYYHLNYTSNNIEWSAISSKYLYEYMYDYMMKYVKKYNPQVIIYDSLAKWGGLLAKKFNIHSIAIEVATDIEEANCFYEKFYNEVVLEEIRLDEEQGKIKKNELLEINNWNEFLEYYDKVQMYVYRKFKTLMNFNERKILPDKLFVYSTRNLYESYSNHMKNVEFCGYDSNILSQLDLKEKSGAYVTRGTSIDYYSQNILRNILSEIKSMDINIDIILACICGLYILLYLLFKNGLYIKMLNYRNAKSRYLQSINEQIAFIDYVQIHVIYRAFLKRLEKYYDVFYKKGILLQKNSNLYVLVQSVIYLVGFSLVIYFAGTDLANGRITVGQFTIIFTYMGIALSNTNLILTFGQTYQNTKTSYNRIKELYQLELREDGLLKKETVNFIEAKDISYIFENGNGLNKISADFQKGKRYLICGSNGAGKTTFINILIRQYKSLSGDIFIDNINIKKINYEQLRLNCFSVMNQEQKFPSVSVVEYINLSNNTEYSTREIIDRLIMKDMYNIAMDIHEVLEKETQNINMLSGGEKQKVELVKTILKDADVYFFDEPTAHLDQESRDEYYQYLKKQKDKIIVVVSHNSQERQYFDVIYEV